MYSSPLLQYLPLGFNPFSEMHIWGAERKQKARSPRGGMPGKSDEKKQRAGARNRVLLVGRVLELALYRAEVLRSKGFEVQVSTSKNDALDLIHRRDYDVVVLTYTLPDAVVRELTEEMREYCPECPVIAIANTAVPDRAIHPDRMVLADEGPAALISALRHVLRQH